jgi:hypothetical protein
MDFGFDVRLVDKLMKLDSAMLSRLPGDGPFHFQAAAMKRHLAALAGRDRHFDHRAADAQVHDEDAAASFEGKEIGRKRNRKSLAASLPALRSVLRPLGSGRMFHPAMLRRDR